MKFIMNYAELSVINCGFIKQQPERPDMGNKSSAQMPRKSQQLVKIQITRDSNSE